MLLSPGLRKLALTTHVTVSVGWLGAVVAFLALAVAGLASDETQTVRSAYVATQLVTWYVIVPLASATLATGLVQSLGTTWGLFRHYWVVAKLVLTLLATLLLLVHTQPIDHVAGVAAERALEGDEMRGLRVQLVVDAAAAVVVLLAAAALSVYKPRGLTPYGWRKEREGASQRKG